MAAFLIECLAVVQFAGLAQSRQTVTLYWPANVKANTY
jgi:hypothetical protein